MPVSGVVVSCAAARVAVVADSVAAVEGVEVHEILPEGKVVAVVEHDTVDGEVKIVSALHEIDGVTSVRLAYHNFEDLGDDSVSE